MTDEAKPEPNAEPQAAAPTSEPTAPEGATGSLLDEVGKPAAEPKSNVDLKDLGLTPEQYQSVISHTDSALDGLRRSFDEKFDKLAAERGLRSGDEVNQLLEQTREQTRQEIAAAEARAEAKANLKLFLERSGISVDSPEAKQVFDEYKAGGYGPEVLMNEKRLRGLIVAAGLELPKDELAESKVPDLQMPRVSVPQELSGFKDDGKPMTAQERLAQARQRTMEKMAGR